MVMDLTLQPISSAEGRPDNNLLKLLTARDYALLAPNLQPVAFSQEAILYRPGEPVTSAFFPCGAAMASFVITGEDGREVETALIGREGAVGGVVSKGYLPAYSRIIVKHAGSFMRIRLTHLDAAKRQSPSLADIFTRYADCLFAQLMQSAACNAVHSIEQRTARWIIAALERTGSQLVTLTREQLARLLGVGRSYTSRITQEFCHEGIIETRRGALYVRDPERLRRKACGCNTALEAHFNVVLAGAYPDDTP